MLQLEETNIKAPGDSEVQITIMARPINPSDEMFVQGVYRQKPSFPQIAGLEGAGIITDCGKNVNLSLLGKRAAFRAAGAWAEKINISLSACRLVPDDLPFETACQLSLNALTAYALLDSSKVGKDQWLVLTAANSSVSQLVVQMAVQKGVRVIGIVRNDSQKDKLTALGASLVVNMSQEDIIQVIRARVTEGVNAVFDAVGGDLGSKLFKIAASHCTVIIYGRLSNDPVSFYNGDVIYKNMLIQGFGIDAWLQSKTQEEIDALWNQIIGMWEEGVFKTSFDRIFRLTDFRSAIVEYKDSGQRILL